MELGSIELELIRAKSADESMASPHPIPQCCFRSFRRFSQESRTSRSLSASAPIHASPTHGPPNTVFLWGEPYCLRPPSWVQLIARLPLCSYGNRARKGQRTGQSAVDTASGRTPWVPGQDSLHDPRALGFPGSVSVSGVLEGSSISCPQTLVRH